MKSTKVKKLLILFIAILLVVATAACNNAPQGDQATATMAPESQATAQDSNAELTAEPTATPDPYAGLRYWEIDTDKKIYNILLLGLDALEGTTYARNDTTMILQMNLETNQMKLVSFMRDMYVNIPGNGQYRLNNAHYRGGPELAMQTMKSVFGVDIDYYAVVDFVSFTQIMRVVGPIIIDVKDYEVAHLKIAESAVSVEGEMIGGQGVVQHEGEYAFNEYLTLSYARDRHSSGEGNERSGDYGRNLRQREVIKAAWDTVKSKPLALIPPSVFLARSYINTNMDESLIITLTRMMMENGAEIEDMAIPIKGKFWSLWVNKDRTATYTNDELEAKYAEKKAAYYDEGQSEETPTATGGEVTPDPEVTARPSFPSYDSWRKSNEFSNVIDWSKNSNVAALHEFLGID